ncbi:MAG: polysaccharide deacetylase family protein [Desulfobacteraceae bacterium]|jgi:polysaccharide deacetylase family protein (PEP-CTERM system associated)
MTKKKNILITIDVEDWFQVENLRPWLPPQTWNQQQLRVENNTHRLLDLLDSIKTTNPTNPPNSVNPKATFFILGWVAKKAPQLVREIHKRGHEIASHGYSHMMCNQLDPDELQQDLIRSKYLLEDAIGIAVRGYRAPNFSINDQALKAIQAAGYKYDSSYNNFSNHRRYGQLTGNRTKKQNTYLRFNNDFYELPISNMQIANQIVPWGGGGYFRFLPFPIFKAGIKQILKKQEAYMFYLHPWEIDPNQPKIKKAIGLSGWRHYLNLDKTYPRLKKLISTFKDQSLITCSQYIEKLKKNTVETHRHVSK